jgi:prepilin signal peptidase PulO-like enzyme (type II secretory pathway)
MTLYLFVLGLIFGSFALVVADRSIKKKDWVKGRSSCDYCHKTLQFYDLVPLFSWLSTRGKCRYCAKKLSIVYPITEFILGLAFAGSYIALHADLQGLGTYIQLALWLSGLVLMCVLFIIDARTMLLPYKFLKPLIGIAAVYASIEIVQSTNTTGALVSVLASVLVASGVFGLLFVISKGAWIGDSDVLFGLVIGLFLMNPLEAWLAIIIACMTGLLFAVGFSLCTNKSIRNTKIPFGPFLIFGLYCSFLFGAQIVSWYVDAIVVV